MYVCVYIYIHKYIYKNWVLWYNPQTKNINQPSSINIYQLFINNNHKQKTSTNRGRPQPLLISVDYYNPQYINKGSCSSPNRKHQPRGISNTAHWEVIGHLWHIVDLALISMPFIYVQNLWISMRSKFYPLWEVYGSIGSMELVASSWCEVSSDSSGSLMASLGHWAPARATEPPLALHPLWGNDEDIIK